MMKGLNAAEVASPGDQPMIWLDNTGRRHRAPVKRHISRTFFTRITQLIKPIVQDSSITAGEKHHLDTWAQLRVRDLD